MAQSLYSLDMAGMWKNRGLIPAVTWIDIFVYVSRCKGRVKELVTMAEIWVLIFVWLYFMFQSYKTIMKYVCLEKYLENYNTKIQFLPKIG